MDMHHIRYFLAVCETLNFTRAAEQCHVTQPALSRAIQQLEVEMGGLLFRRERNQTHLTDLGALLKPRLRDVYDNTNDAKMAAQRFLTLEEAHVTVGVMCTIGPTRFIGLLAEIQGANPGLEIRLTEGNPPHLIQQLEAGELDVAITASAAGYPERFDVHPLYRERFVLAFPPGHRFAALNAVPMATITGENYLRRMNCEYYDQLSELCDRCHVDLPVAHASERDDWIQNMVAAGLGVCFIPEYSAVVPGVLTRPIIEPEVWRDVSLVTVSGRRFSPAQSAFLSAVKAYGWPGHGAEQDPVAA
jgi:DNA-binding transcriptional LysR family regulator